ncbi:3-methylornithine synthase [Desulfosarcina cetonica]|uniref:radical SAM protein n=1 Tax=Desulfosarcina cetonica TaxID=90730 RepID=UPI0006D29058|nr:radical SAM protein [Desulfosarcina cetonica]VTR65507.1 3-methylornithine synthase [Desulfosarcina cetonica]
MKKAFWTSAWPGDPRGTALLTAALDKAAVTAGIPPSAMIRLLDSPTPALLDHLFAAARSQRACHFDNRIFLYGTLYATTHCRQRCSFCYYRKNNTLAKRYRLHPDQVIEQARQLAAVGVHLIDLTGGEDPACFSDDPRDFDPLIELVGAVSRSTDLPVMVSMGLLPSAVLDRMYAAGACWYACHQETYNRQRFGQLRVSQDFDSRYQSKIVAREIGLRVADGVFCGVGETSPDLLAAFDAMVRLGAEQVCATTFIPQAGTPMHDEPATPLFRECIAIALLRISFPHLIIPARLDAKGISGLRERLHAGANAVVVPIPPDRMESGDAGGTLVIPTCQRTMAGVVHTLRDCDLEPDTHEGYRDWLQQHRSTSDRCVGGSH